MAELKGDYRKFMDKNYLGAWDVPDGEDLVLMIAEISGNQASLDKSSPIVFKQNTSASKVTFETEQGICAKTDSYFWQGGLFQGKTTWTKND